MPNPSDWEPLERLSKTALERERLAMGRPEPSDSDYLAAIRLFTEEHGYPPTEPEVAALVGTRQSEVNERLFDLERRGLISRAHTPSGKAKTRTLRVVDNPRPASFGNAEVNVNWRKAVQEKVFPPKPVVANPDTDEIVNGHARVMAALAVNPEALVPVEPQEEAGDWELLARKKPKPKGPTVPRETWNTRLYYGGQLRVTEVMYDHLGRPEWVLVYLNRANMTLAVVPATKGDKGAIRMYEINSGKGLHVMSLGLMFKTAGIDPEWYDAEEPHALGSPLMPEHLRNGVGVMLVKRTTRRTSRKGRSDDE